jgi:hypothetical protein
VAWQVIPQDMPGWEMAGPNGALGSELGGVVPRKESSPSRRQEPVRGIGERGVMMKAALVGGPHSSQGRVPDSRARSASAAWPNRPDRRAWYPRHRETRRRRTPKVIDQRTAQDFAECTRDLVDVHYPRADLIRVVMDNLPTYSSLYEAFRAGRGSPHAVPSVSRPTDRRSASEWSHRSRLGKTT